MVKFKVIFIALLFIAVITATGSQLGAEEVTAPVNLKKVADDMKFKNAMEFYRLEKFDRALNEFYEYIEIYYDGIHRGEAYRKIAEIHIKKFNYQKAIDAYNNLYQEYSGSDEGLDAYFQAGVCYKKMGFNSKAEAIFKYLVQNHSGTAAAYNAEIQLDLIRMEDE